MSIWTTVLQSLKKKVSPQAYNDWLKPTYEVSHDDKVLRVKVPNERFREHLEKQYNKMIQEILRESDWSHLSVEFFAEGPTQLSLAHLEEAKASPTPASSSKLPLNPNYTFDNFVPGPFNQFAQAAAIAVAGNLSKAYNPLFIYGGSGLGKTHLLHAIGHSVHKSNPQARLIYISTEEFTNEFIRALRLEKTQEFREKYRTADLLLIDDIHMLAGKNQTQEEFFHTFNALYENQKQLVLASDLLPREIPGLRDRLTSRFQGGLIEDIQLPDVESKVAILHKKATATGTHLADDGAWFISRLVQSNMRELDG